MVCSTLTMEMRVSGFQAAADVERNLYIEKRAFQGEAAM